MHRAAERGDVAVLERYLKAGGDPERKDVEYGAAPIHWASLVRIWTKRYVQLLPQASKTLKQFCPDLTSRVQENKLDMIVHHCK